MDKQIVPTQVKHTIIDLRVRAGLSQVQAANKMHVSRTTIQGWEKDPTKIPVGAIDKFSKLYEIPTDYIFFGPNTAFSVQGKGE